MHKPSQFELEQLLHPWRAFRDPNAVVDDPELSLAEKRAVLASWASDACAVEAAPGLRATPTGAVVRYDDIIDALQRLDKHPRRLPTRFRRQTRKRRFEMLRRRSTKGGKLDDQAY